MIDQLQLEDCAGFHDPAGQPKIGFGRGGVARWVIVNEDKSIGTEREHGFQNFPRMGERFVQSPVADRDNLNELLLGVERSAWQRQRPISRGRTEVHDCAFGKRAGSREQSLTEAYAAIGLEDNRTSFFCRP